MTHRRVLLNRLYAEYEAEDGLAHMRAAGSRLVRGAGPVRPRFMFVGEAPGQNEDKLGLPFIGASGRFLEELLASVGLLRTDVFITNTVKYRPVDDNRRNRPPTDAELFVSIPFLRKEWAILGRPPMVVLGKHAKRAASLLPEYLYLPNAKMTVGEWCWLGDTPLLPLHHPAYGLYQQRNRPLLFEHFQALLEVDAFVKGKP